MGKCIVVMVLLLLSLPHLQSYHPSDLKIDCGATEKWEEKGFSNFKWELDDEFIKTGQNKLLPTRNSQRSMDTLRYFPDGGKNCYNVGLHLHNKYILRAGFYYGNYDNLSRKRMSAYMLRANTEGQVPLISSLEAKILNQECTATWTITPHCTWREGPTMGPTKVSRKERLSDYYEAFSRFWKPEQVQNYRNFFGKNKSSTSSAENIPPYLVLQSAIEAKNVSDSIFLPINLHDKTQLVAYFVLYFYEPYPWPPANDTRRLTVYIDGERKNITTVPRTELSDDCAVVSVYPVNVTGTANVTISPAEGTTLPPILNAMEVFTTIDFSKADLLPPLLFHLLRLPLSFWSCCMV
ncbi:putative LRR receptor-like serine/threonine-protein kinase [Vitis vinifera]|uniref:Putative LRR receptor-like serine/threonine-protein kinase n=1 Tax=Vitis vinifera TaxID=29760 RepID=A0A438FAN5_VITVI|nr:putative LRR receptor-like serine/threonine-protein kinase [Vitis vinifera]